MSESYEYEHAIYRAGLNVYVDPAIRDIHPLSPIAGQVVQTTTGIVYKNLEPFEDQTAKVPVIANDGSCWYVEQEYIQAD